MQNFVSVEDAVEKTTDAIRDGQYVVPQCIFDGAYESAWLAHCYISSSARGGLFVLATESDPDVEVEAEFFGGSAFTDCLSFGTAIPYKRAVLRMGGVFFPDLLQPRGFNVATREDSETGLAVITASIIAVPTMANVVRLESGEVVSVGLFGLCLIPVSTLESKIVAEFAD